jgi:hypothetical protein
MNIRQICRTIILLLAIALPGAPSHVRLFGQQAGHVVISEVYGGGGNSGSTYTHDFIELYNSTGSDVVMTNWSVQYQSGSGTGAFSAVAKISGTIRASRFFLVQANPGSGGTTPLPTPDAVAGITLAASSGKVALCSDTIAVAGPGSPGVVDFVGYGSANIFEGAGPAVAPGNATSVERKASAGSDASSMGPGGAEERYGNGRDSDDNANDFIRRDPAPQNDGAQHHDGVPGKMEPRLAPPRGRRPIRGRRIPRGAVPALRLPFGVRGREHGRAGIGILGEVRRSRNGVVQRRARRPGHCRPRPRVEPRRPRVVAHRSGRRRPALLRAHRHGILRL